MQGRGQQLSLEEQAHLLGYHYLHETLARGKDSDHNKYNTNKRNFLDKARHRDFSPVLKLPISA